MFITQEGHILQLANTIDSLSQKRSNKLIQISERDNYIDERVQYILL